MTPTKELRRLAQAATPGPWHATKSVETNSWAVWSDTTRLMELRPTKTVDMYRVSNTAAFIAAANPAAVSELLDRLEAAEKERDKLKELNTALCRNSNSQVIHNARLAEENYALRAKIEHMEKQEPVGEVVHNGESAGLYDTLEPGSLVCTLPGAQNVPEKLCYDSRWEISIDYVDGWNAAVDMMRGKSPSWHCPDCCIAFPFGAPKSCPNDDARCNRLLTAEQEAKT